MAYMNQKMKSDLQPKVAEILNKYHMKGRLSVRNHSTLVLKIKSGKLDMLTDCARTCAASYGGKQEVKTCVNVNPYHVDRQHSGRCLQFLKEVLAAMNTGNWDRSDVQVDYFDKGWYVEIQIGTWDKPYLLLK